MFLSHQGICTSFMGGSNGWAFAIKKDCNGKHKDWTCDKLCGSMNEGQVLASYFSHAIYIYIYIYKLGSTTQTVGFLFLPYAIIHSCFAHTANRTANTNHTTQLTTKHIYH